MEYVSLGQTGLRVSRLCFGSLTVGPLCADLPPEQGAELILRGMRQGINFIDTAEQYANYRHIAMALEQFSGRDGVIVATKTFAETDTEASWAIEDARLALRRDTLDIMLLHEVRDADDFRSRTGAWQMLQNMKRVGVITAIGLSTHSAAVVKMAAQLPEVDVIHCMLNQRGIGILDGDLEEMLSAMRLAKAAGKGIYTMKALGGGALMHQAREALEWVFSRSEADAVAVGCRDIAELDTNLHWLAGEDAPQAGLIRLIDRNIAFDKEPKCHGCGACVRKCPTGAMTLGEDGTACWNKVQCVYCGYCIAACQWFCLSFC